MREVERALAVLLQYSEGRLEVGGDGPVFSAYRALLHALRTNPEVLDGGGGGGGGGLDGGGG